MKRFVYFFLLLLAFMISCGENPVFTNQHDIATVNRIAFENIANDSISLFFDGRLDGKYVNDSVLTTLSGEILLENINNSEKNNEIVAFTASRRPMIIENINWEGDLDTVFSFENNITLPIIGWVIYIGNTSFEYQKNRILRGVEDCNRIFEHEGTGIQFEINLIDVSDMNNISDHYNLASLVDMNKVANFLEVEDTKLNLFFTKTVANNPQGAYTTFLISEYKNHIAFGMHAVDGGIIAHEIAHTLTLLHYTEEMVGIHNVMLDIPTLRNYFSEGQVYQMWYNPESSLYSVYNLPLHPRLQNNIYNPGPYLEAWDEMNMKPYFIPFFDNDSIQ